MIRLYKKKPIPVEVVQYDGNNGSFLKEWSGGKVIESPVLEPTEDNPSAVKKILAKAGQHNCPICPPWDGENKVSRTPKRGAKKPKYKNKRK